MCQGLMAIPPHGPWHGLDERHAVPREPRRRVLPFLHDVVHEAVAAVLVPASEPSGRTVTQLTARIRCATESTSSAIVIARGS